MTKQRWGFDRNVLRPTPGDPWGVEQHHWNTGAKENQQLNPGGPSNRQKSSGPNQLKKNSFMSGPSLSLTPTGTLEQRKTNSWTPLGQATDKKLRPKPTKINSFVSGRSNLPRQCHGIQSYVFQGMRQYSVCAMLFQVIPDYAMDCNVMYIAIKVILRGNPWNLDSHLEFWERLFSITQFRVLL